MSPPAIQTIPNTQNTLNDTTVCFQLAEREIFESVKYTDLCNVVGRDNLLIKLIDEQLKESRERALISVPMRTCGSATCQLKEFEMFVQLLRAGRLSVQRPTAHMIPAIHTVIDHFQLNALKTAV
jgi:hypothetical protein